ncbi:hypothetical protein [Brevundimonas naejangsanensis]|uniref:hypothetical protein n=1 Tax=Brevundimonas naejangsanensis TaxID=588932 RepID=UPI00106CD0DA|nr:hypothetical protein [Brevundimonas naejangsanensis]QBQ48914.1 hypothetical protein E3U41_09600 [Brevundimonas naejangsanensis]
MSDLRARFSAHAEDFIATAEDAPFTVFLFGPSLDTKEPKPSASLRRRLQVALEDAKFEVVLGEDESINDPRIKEIGINIQDSEIEFAKKYCNAIVIIADSVGSFCELGLFSWHYAHKDGMLAELDFILIVDKQFKTPNSYLNQGPALAVHGKGMLKYDSFDTFDVDDVVSRLRARRGTYTVETRGRPRKVPAE